VARIDALVIGRQSKFMSAIRLAKRKQPLALFFGILEVARQHVRVGKFKIIT
jgi:hypothetical protein